MPSTNEIREYPPSDVAAPRFRGRTIAVGLFLGIDGGGSKTTCVVGDDARVLSSATAAGSNVIRLGEVKARESLQKAIRDACEAAHVDPHQIMRTCLGLSGGDRAIVSDTVKKIIAEIVSGEIEVVGDSVTTLHACFGEGPGIVVIAGTGSLAYGRNSAGKTARAGGWGFAISDEGSGQWIGRTAVSASLRARDEQQSTALLAAILKAWALPSVDELIPVANASPAPDFSALFPSVLACGESGDEVARSVLTQAGTELAALAKIIARQLFEEIDVIHVAMSGSVFRESALVRQIFNNSLRAKYANVKVLPDVIDPVNGALELARRGQSGS
jgi:glucosamine kinase